MRPLTFGVLASLVPEISGGSATHPARATPRQSAAGTSYDDLDGRMDLQSAIDLVDGLRSLGHRPRLLAASPDLDLALRGSEADACLLALHGRAGGSGEVQALLSMRGVPYFGPGSAAVALAFDKVRSRHLLAYHNLPVPAAVAIGAQHRASDRALELLGWPCFVKPRRGSHGRGVALLTGPTQLRHAIEQALEVDDELVLERALHGREVQVVVLGERVIGSAEVVNDPEVGIFDPVVPETPTRAVVCPPRCSVGQRHGIHNLARRAVAALGLEDGLTRVDVLVDDRHNEMILEVEPLPSLARDGVVARVAKAAGMAYEELLGEILERLMLRAPEDRFLGTAPLMQ